MNIDSGGDDLCAESRDAVETFFSLFNQVSVSIVVGRQHIIKRFYTHGPN